MTKPPKTTLTMAGNSRRPAAGRGPAQPPRGRQPGRGGEPPPRGKSSSKRPRGASVERRKAENIFENLAQSSVSSSDSESDKASKASSKKSRAEFKDTKMVEKEDILSILGDDSSEYTSNDEEEYDQAADAHKLQQSSEEEEEQEDEEEGFYPEEADGEEKEEEEDQCREEPDDPGTEDDETAKDDARQNPGIDNLRQRLPLNHDQNHKTESNIILLYYYAHVTNHRRLASGPILHIQSPLCPSLVPIFTPNTTQSYYNIYLFTMSVHGGDPASA